MKKKFEEGLKAAVKDFGLSHKAVKELCERGAAIIDDDATEDTLKAHVDLFVDVARAMQGEVTRKVQAAKDQNQPEPAKEGREEDGKPADGLSKDLAKLLAGMQKQLDMLAKSQREATEARAEESRVSMIKAAAERIGVDDEFLKIIDTSKVRTEQEANDLLGKARQFLVNDRLPRKGTGGTQGRTGADETAEAETWAKTLADKSR